MSTGKVEVFTGDDWSISVSIMQDCIAKDVSGASEIKALVSDGNAKNPKIVIPEVICSAAADGADWANGLVVAEFTAAMTQDLTTQTAYLEIQITENSKKTTPPRAQFDIKKGLIT